MRFCSNRQALFAIMALLVLTSSCSFTASKRIAERAVERFHSQIDAEQYREVYIEADPEFHRVSSESDFTAFLKNVHQKLGAVHQAKLVGYQVNAQLGSETSVILSYRTHFANEMVTEQFTWRVIGDKATLVRYDIESGESKTVQSRAQSIQGARA